MNLFILRHASAGTRRLNPALDVKRPLDKDGKRHCLHLAHILNSLQINFDLIVSSPLKRSLQTAQLVGTETGYETPILISNALAPAATYAQFQRLLRECSPYENVLVVGHNPNITMFLANIVTGAQVAEGSRQPANIRLRKGSLARLSLQRGPATLQWLLDPRTVRALYATSTKSSRRKTSRK
jgi:phosphohistidine phosphatase